MEKEYPVNPVYKVIEAIDIYRTAKWIKAALIIEGFGKKSIAVYQWINQNDKWKRKQKMGVKNADEWTKIKEAINTLIEKL